jgi:hypothetical protein
MSREVSRDAQAVSKAPSGRVTRTPVGKRNLLTVGGKDPNYVYRIVNDREDRISQFLEAGYELVPADDVTVGDKRVNNPSALGSAKQISVGGGQKAFVMRIKREWYEEDQIQKQAHVNELERATKEKALSGTYGELRIER